MKKYLKRVAPLMMSAVMLGSLPATNVMAEDGYGSAPSGEVTIWGWDETEILKDHLAEIYPDVTVNYVTIAQADLPKKIQTTLASGAQMPDIVQLESTTRGKMYSLDCWEDLSGEPYNVDKDIFTVDQLLVSVNEDGNLLGLPMGSVPSAMAYKRSLAKEYFGTDDPEELSAMFTTWEDYIEKGQEVTEKSNGSVKMFAGLSDLYNVLSGQTIIPFTEGDKLNVEASLTPILEELVKIKKAGIVDTLEESSPALMASYADDTHIFYPCAQWSPRWILKPNDSRDGEWGLMELAGGAVNWGGGVYSIPNTAQNKEAAFAIIKWLTVDPESAVPRRDELEVFTAIKSVYEDPEFYSRTDSFFGGQDIDKLFAYTIIPKMDETNVRPLNKYDVEVKDAVSSALKTINASADGNVDVSELIDQIETDILSRCPELSK
ncbi:MAG: extracellular solute-binding protein [Eubacteriales bacterium]|nr:extracellular solute-binding protein [Eubacteriales bacterium]